MSKSILNKLKELLPFNDKVGVSEEIELTLKDKDGNIKHHLKTSKESIVSKADNTNKEFGVSKSNVSKYPNDWLHHLLEKVRSKN